MKTSYSALELFKQCPQKYKFQIIDRIPVPKSKEALFGTFIHDALKFIHEKEPVFPSHEELLAWYEMRWETDIAGTPWIDEYEERTYKEHGKQILNDYYGRLDKAKPHVIDLESSFSVLLEDAQGKQHIVKGKIDRIDKLEDGVFEIIDYKTNRKLPSQDSVDGNLQLSIYHLALLARWPNLHPEEVRLSLYFLKHNEKISTVRTAAQLAETKAEILKTIDEIQKSDFPPQPSKLCDYCEYKPRCPVWRHSYDVKKDPIGNEEIKRIVDEYLSLKENVQANSKRIDELKEIIDEFCTAHGIERTFGDTGYITRKLQKRYAYEIALVKEILEPLRLWNEVLEVDGARLAEIAKALPLEVRKRLEAAKKVETEYKVFTATRK